MTRFARAKGSKASNERQPAEATPWHVMKQQLETVKGTENLEKTKSPRKKEDPYYCDTLVTNSDWAKFDAPKPSKSTKKNNSEKKSPKEVSSENSVSNDLEFNKSRKRKSEKIEKSAGEVENVPKKKKKNKSANAEAGLGAENVSKKKIKKKSVDLENGAETLPKKEVNKSVDSEKNSTEEKNVSNVKLSKRQKRNRKKVNNKTNIEKEETTTPIELNVDGNDWSTEIKFGASKSNCKPKNPNNQDQQFSQKVIKQKPGKIRDDLEHERRKPEHGDQKVIINGAEVEIVKFDRFPVMKDDAERLEELRKKMLMNGIPKPDINRAIKAERRKAERALAKKLKTICFHCRKGGHNLSDCPELGREEAAFGICFKCGSTEHTHLECKVVKKEEFRFAKCFICREQGHVAKQCPDNPAGLYPSGGSCHMCGDVTHLKKDCPELISQKEGNKITLSTIADVDSVETIDGLDKKNKSQVEAAKKIVKF